MLQTNKLPEFPTDARHVLVLTDFDGTLTQGDTLWPFLQFAAGQRRLLLHGPRLAFRLLGLLLSGKWSAGNAKALTLRVFLGKIPCEKLLETGLAFCRERLPGLIRAEILARLKDGQIAGARVVVVSASLDIWLRPFCQDTGFGLICTEANFRDGRFWGFATPNCKREEKVRRIRLALNPGNYERVLALGNSQDDEAMFGLAHEAWRCNRSGLFKKYLPQAKF